MFDAIRAGFGARSSPAQFVQKHEVKAVSRSRPTHKPPAAAPRTPTPVQKSLKTLHASLMTTAKDHIAKAQSQRPPASRKVSYGKHLCFNHVRGVVGQPSWWSFFINAGSDLAFISFHLDLFSCALPVANGSFVSAL